MPKIDQATLRNMQAKARAAFGTRLRLDRFTADLFDRRLPAMVKG